MAIPTGNSLFTEARVFLSDWRSALQLLQIAHDHPMVTLNIGITSAALGLVDRAGLADRRFLTQADGERVSNVVRYDVLNHLSFSSGATKIMAPTVVAPGTAAQYVVDADD
jgi:hypothetical protein